LRNHLTRDVRPRKPYIPPAFTLLHPTHDPSPILLQKVRSSLKELGAILRVNPNDSGAAELQQALRRTLAELESKQPVTAH
jgi:hypothetical protein